MANANEFWVAAAGGSALIFTIFYLLFSTKAKLGQISDKAATQKELSDAVINLSGELERLRSEISELKKKPEPVDKMPEGLGLNLNTRGHILRLYRRGESVSDIASALRLTKGEVNLIVRVHEMSRMGSGDSPRESLA